MAIIIGFLGVGDRLVLGAEAFQDEINIKLKEVILYSKHNLKEGIDIKI